MVPSLLCTFIAHIIFLHVFFLSPFLSLSLSLSLFLSLPLSLSLAFSLSLCLSVVASHVSYDALYQAAQCMCMGCHMYPLLNQSYFSQLIPPKLIYNSPTIHRLFFRLPYSELLEKRLFRSRANRRLVSGRPWHSICAIGSPSARLCHNIIAVPPGTVVHTYIYIYTYVYVYVYMYNVCIYIYIYVCIYVCT